MAITNGYCTLAQLKTSLGISDSTDDTPLERIVANVSRWIDTYTGRQFWVTTSEVRYFTPFSPFSCVIDDAVTVTAAAIDTGDRGYATALASTDYDLLPFAATGQPEPYTLITVSPNGVYRFYPTVQKSLKLTGTWGVPSTCSWTLTVTEACILQSSRIWKRKDAPFGVAGVGELGSKTLEGLDPDVKQMLAAPVRRTMRSR